MTADSVPTCLADVVAALEDELLGFRRDLHHNPEVAWDETRTTSVIADRLGRAGIRFHLLDPTGLVAEIGPDDAEHVVALRGDIDALPLPELTHLPWASRIAGVSHACGHDVHTTVALGAALALHELRDTLDARGLAVRVVFQPAEETMPGGAQMVVRSGVLDDVDAVFALHCDPGRDVGSIGLRRGAITAASDAVTVVLTGPGGHTSRPHLTGDLTYALAKVVTDLPGALSRRLDPRSSAALVWGAVHAGSAPNVIPGEGRASGTLRMLDATTWEHVGPLLSELVAGIVAPYAVEAELVHTRGVPPVVNTPEGIDAFRVAAQDVLGPGAAQRTEQSLGGEDFAWMLKGRRGAFARLGTRTPQGTTYDLHRGDLVVDERAVGVGTKLLAAVPFAAQVLTRRESARG